MASAKIMLDAISCHDKENIRSLLSTGQWDESTWYGLVSDAIGCFEADLRAQPCASMKLPTVEEPIVRLPELNGLSILHMMAEHCSTKSHKIQMEFKRALADSNVIMGYKPIYERLMEVLTTPLEES